MPGEAIDIDVLPPEQSAEVQDSGTSPPTEPPAALAILEAIRSGNADPQKVMMSVLGEQSSDRPEVGMLFKLISDSDSEGADSLREQVREEIREEQAEAFAELSAATEKLIEENEASRRRLDSLAAAIGACPCCFGEDLLCETCGGAGAPGSKLPQAEEFHHYVRPAVERVKAALRRPHPRRPWPRNPPANAGGRQTPQQAGAAP